MYSVGHIHSAHRLGTGVGLDVTDIDIHPNGTSMATSGKDKHVRFWTYPSAGGLNNDCFHGG